MEVQVGWSREAGVIVASLGGRVDSGNSAAFRDALEEGIPEGERALVLDCGRLSYMSSAGLRVLLVIARKFQGPDQAIGMCRLTETIRSVVSHSGFDKIIPVHGSLADAVTEVSGEESVGDAHGGSEAVGDSREVGGPTPISLPNPINLDVVGDNIADIAAFTVEKHEFTNDDLPAEVREEALAAIRDVLWQEIEGWKQRRQELLARAFRTAAETLQDVLAK